MGTRRRWCTTGMATVLVVVLTALGGTHTASASSPPPVMSAAPADYVALGDSYASGEGVEPFLPGSNAARPEDRCHRSALAYPQLLADRPGMPPASQFWACSGARIGNFYPGPGQWGEPGQLEHLSVDTRLVTLSAGGNDLQFASVLGTCFVTRGCDRTLGLGANLLLQHTDPRLADLYREVLARGGRAQVFVIGYPRFVDPTPSVLCLLTGLDVVEAHWIDSEVVRADATIRRIVDGIADPRLHYVSTLDAFAGGQACSPSGRYVNGLVPRHPVYSFHPTAAGQAVLAEWVGRAIAASGAPG
jgi:lysophospholipase L1-like esterase